MNRPKLVLTEKRDAMGLPIFRLLEDYNYVLGPTCTIPVPKGYETNFGTIPRLARWFVSPVQLGEAAIVHDWMCNEDNRLLDNGSPPNSGYSRWMADAVLYEIMARMRLGRIKRVGVYLAVVSYGVLKHKATYAEPPEIIDIDKDPIEDSEWKV